MVWWDKNRAVEASEVQRLRNEAGNHFQQQSACRLPLGRVYGFQLQGDSLGQLAGTISLYKYWMMSDSTMGQSGLCASVSSSVKWGQSLAGISKSKRQLEDSGAEVDQSPSDSRRWEDEVKILFIHYMMG